MENWNYSDYQQWIKDGGNINNEVMTLNIQN